MLEGAIVAGFIFIAMLLMRLKHESRELYARLDRMQEKLDELPAIRERLDEIAEQPLTERWNEITARME